MHIMTLPGSSRYGRIMKTVLPGIGFLAHAPVRPAPADRGYRRDQTPSEYEPIVIPKGQKRDITPTIRKQLRRRNAVEHIVGRVKNEDRMGRNSPC